jgi:hypothetical protein
MRKMAFEKNDIINLFKDIVSKICHVAQKVIRKFNMIHPAVHVQSIKQHNIFLSAQIIFNIYSYTTCFSP